MFRWALFIGVLLMVGVVRAQDKGRDYMPTPNVAEGGTFNKKKFRPKRKTYPKIIKNHPEGTLYGNPCALNATRAMGFEYDVQVPGLPGSKSNIGHFLNNFWVKARLVVTRSPFWKLILKRKLKNCRGRSGDGIG